MEPKLNLFLYVNGGILLLLLAYMYFWRAKIQPSRLKLTESKKRIEAAPKSSRDAGPGAQAPPAAPTKERVLNVIFQFNGHDFDAYEVLGVRAGSGLDAVEKAYRSLLSKTATDEHEFYRKAFESIRAKN